MLTSPTVKTLRLWFLLLLAVLLPIRGAVAAAMLCPVAGVGTQTEWQVHEHPVGHAHEVDDADHAAHHADAAPGDHAKASDSHDKCNLCSAFCSVTPLMSSAPVVLAPQDFSAVVFPAMSAPAPTFLSSGPERPPRSI